MCTSVSSSTSAEKIQEYHKLILWTSDPCQKNDRAIRFTRSTSIHWFLRLYSIKMPIEKVQHGMTACGKEKRFTQPKYMQQSHKHHKKKKTASRNTPNNASASEDFNLPCDYYKQFKVSC